MANKRILIADPSAAFRTWLGRNLGHHNAQVKEVAMGWEVLEHLADTPCDLVILTAYLTDIPCTQLLAMIRTAGLRVPVLLVYPGCPTAPRRTATRAGLAVVIEDVVNARILREVVLRLMGISGPSRIVAARPIAGRRPDMELGRADSEPPSNNAG